MEWCGVLTKILFYLAEVHVNGMAWCFDEDSVLSCRGSWEWYGLVLRLRFNSSLQRFM